MEYDYKFILVTHEDETNSVVPINNVTYVGEQFDEDGKLSGLRAIERNNSQKLLNVKETVEEIYNMLEGINQ